MIFERIENNIEQKIQTIEKSSLKPDKKLDLMLLLLNKKKIAFIGDAKEVFRGKDEIDSRKRFLQEIGELEDMAAQIGFSIKLNIRDMYQEKDRLLIRYDAYLGWNEEDVDVFINLVKTKIDEEKDPEGFYNEVKNRDNKEIGIMLGYPKTAAETYRTDKALNLDELPESEKKSCKKQMF